MNLNFSTVGMTLSEREELVKHVGLIPIGTEVFKAGDFTEDTEKIIVNKQNQKIITMFWNSLYFLKKEKADIKTNQAHADYNNWQGKCMMEEFGY